MHTFFPLPIRLKNKTTMFRKIPTTIIKTKSNNNDANEKKIESACALFEYFRCVYFFRIHFILVYYSDRVHVTILIIIKF